MRWTCSTTIPEVRVEFPGTAAHSYRYLTDPRNRAHWQSSLRGIQRLTTVGEGSPGSAGTTWRDVTMVPGMAPRMEVTVDDPPHRWTEIGRWGVVDASLTLTFTERSDAEDAGTLVRAQATLSLPVFLRPALPILRLVVPQALSADLRKATRLIGAAGDNG